jgi:hypothetical protein
VGDDSAAGKWPGVSRVGEPELKRGPLEGSLQRPNEYWIRTTRLPGGAHGANWLGYFNSQVSRPPFCGHHDGNKIIIECWPDDDPQLTEKIDSAIEYANERLRELGQ